MHENPSDVFPAPWSPEFMVPGTLCTMEPHGVYGQWSENQGAGLAGSEPLQLFHWGPNVSEPLQLEEW